MKIEVTEFEQELLEQFRNDPSQAEEVAREWYNIVEPDGEVKFCPHCRGLVDVEVRIDEGNGSEDPELMTPDEYYHFCCECGEEL